MSRLTDCLIEPGYAKYDGRSGKELSPLIQAIDRDAIRLSLAMNVLDDATQLGSPAFFREALSVALDHAAMLYATLQWASEEIDLEEKEP